MKKPIIQIVISQSGNVQLKVKGAKGSSCKKLTAELEKSLGTPSSRTLLPEFYENDQDQTTTQRLTL